MTSRFPVLDTVLAGIAASSLGALWFLSPSPYLAPVLLPYALGLSAAWALGCLARLDRCVAQWRSWFVSPAWEIPVAKLPAVHGVAVGKGFPWTGAHTQILELALLQDGFLPTATSSRGGTPALHAVGLAQETVVTLPWSELVGHMGILGTTRSGKTSLLKAVTAQVIGEA